MAKLYGEILSSALMTFDKSFARANGQPLDSTEVYYSLESAKTYAATDGAYIGQKIVVIENNVVTHYSIEDAAGTLKELGSKPIGDGDTITVAEDGTISLAAIPSDAATKTYNAVLVNGKLVWQTPSETTVEGLDTRLQAIESEVGDPATETTDATGLYLAIAEGIQEAKDYADSTNVYYDYALSYDNANHQINLVEGTEIVSSIDATPFIKDGMLHDVAYDADSNTLTFTWNTDSGEKTDTVVLSDILEPYTAGNGINITGNAVSVKVDSSSEYLTVGESGLKVSGVNSAIESAISAHSTTADGKYATKDELKTTDDKANSNTTAIENLTGRIDDIVAEGGEPNQINNIKVNGVVQSIAEDKSINITVPTKVSDLTDDTGFDGRITAAQNAADAAQGTADDAKSKAEQAQNEIDALESEVGGIQTTIAGHTTSINDYLTRITNLEQADITHATEYSTLSDIVSGHTATIAGKAEKSEVEAVSAKASANETAIKIINETTIPVLDEAKADKSSVYTKTEIGTITSGKTLVEMISDAQTAATYNDTEVRGLITDNANAIKEIKETTLPGINSEIARVESLVNTEKSRAEGVEADFEERISDMENFWKAADDPEGTIDKLAEIVSYIESDKSGALDMAANIQANAEAIADIYTAADGETPASGVLANAIKDIDANKTAIAAINNETTGILALAKKYTDDSIAAIPVATVNTLGLVKFDNTTIMMNESNQLYVNQVNVNQLVQTAGEELILNGGSAK